MICGEMQLNFGLRKNRSILLFVRKDINRLKSIIAIKNLNSDTKGEIPIRLSLTIFISFMSIFIVKRKLKEITFEMKKTVSTYLVGNAGMRQAPRCMPFFLILMTTSELPHKVIYPSRIHPSINARALGLYWFWEVIGSYRPKGFLKQTYHLHITFQGYQRGTKIQCRL